MLKLFLYLDIKCKWGSCVASATLLITCSQHFCVSSKDGVGVGAPWPLPGPSCRAACPGTLPLANLTSVLASCMCCGQLCGRASSSWLALPGCPIGSWNDTCPKWNSPQAPFWGMDPQTPVSQLRTHTATPPPPCLHPTSPPPWHLLLRTPLPQPHLCAGIWGGLPRVTVSRPTTTLYTGPSWPQAAEPQRLGPRPLSLWATNSRWLHLILLSYNRVNLSLQIN